MDTKNINLNNVNRFNGFADCYDKYRPAPPLIITEVLSNYLEKKPYVVVDLGCGTGLSTFIWKDYSEKVIGVDPNSDMLKKANEKNKDDNGLTNVLFQIGYSNNTSLKSNSVDIVTCSSSFQWMEPKSTVKEVSRILVDGGVFAIYNHDQPPTIDWVAEKAYNVLFNIVYQTLDNSKEDEGRVRLYSVNEFIDAMKESGEYNFIKEIVFHSKIKMDADGFIGLAYSQGALQDTLKRNNASIEAEIDKFVKNTKERLGDKTYDAIYSYRMRIGIKGN